MKQRIRNWWNSFSPLKKKVVTILIGVVFSVVYFLLLWGKHDWKNPSFVYWWSASLSTVFALGWAFHKELKRSRTYRWAVFIPLLLALVAAIYFLPSEFEGAKFILGIIAVFVLLAWILFCPQEVITIHELVD